MHNKMPESQDDVICVVNEHILIRRFRDEDAETYASYATDDRVWNTQSDAMPHPYTTEHAKDWIKRSRSEEVQAATGNSLGDQHAKKITTEYVIVVDGQPCGGVGLKFQPQVYRLSATLGYWLGAPYQRTGVMSKAIPVFVQWTWDTFGYLIRLNGTAYETNIGSQLVMQTAGFKHEGLRINACIKNGKICNEVMLAALRPGTENAAAATY